MGEPRFITSFQEIGWAEGQRDLLLRQLNRTVGPLVAKLQARVMALAPEAAPGARAVSEQP